MEHPQTAPGGWELDHLVYDDGHAGIAVALLRNDKGQVMALRWLPSVEHTGKDGNKVVVKSWMGDETGWFVLPFDFAVAVGKALIERQVAGLAGFDEAGFKAMVQWLVEFQAVSDALCY